MASGGGEGRLSEYKNKGRTGDGLRHERAEEGVQLRKAKREEKLMKRRNIDDSAEAQAVQDGMPEAVPQYLANLSERLAAADTEMVLQAAVDVRALLSRARGPPIQEVCDCGIVHQLVQLLHRHDRPDIQFEAAWSITNIASGTTEQTQVVMDADAVPIFVQLLSSQHTNLREQCVWALGNISGDNATARDFVLHHGVMEPLLKIFEREYKPTLLQNAAWTLSNLCRGKKPPPPEHLVLPALPMLQRLIHVPDNEIVIDACWALSYLSEGTNDKIDKVIHAGVCQRLVELLMSPCMPIVKPALRTLGNIATGNDVQTQVVINAMALPNLRTLLSNHKDSIRREACWTLSNILAGPAMQVQAVIDATIIKPLIGLMSDSNFKTRKEACWAISNATAGGTESQVRYLVDLDCIPPLCRMLDAHDLRVVKVSLDGLQNILQVGHNRSGPNDFYDILEGAGGVEKLGLLQVHKNAQISEQAQLIVDRFLREHDDMEGTGMPAVPFGAFGGVSAPATGFRL